MDPILIMSLTLLPGSIESASLTSAMAFLGLLPRSDSDGSAACRGALLPELPHIPRSSAVAAMLLHAASPRSWVAKTGKDIGRPVGAPGDASDGCYHLLARVGIHQFEGHGGAGLIAWGAEIILVFVTLPNLK